jgi:hypothetical protein
MWYSIAYSIMRLWLWGSFFLVMLLFLRWCGSKWKTLNCLTYTRNRWLKIWIYFGLIRVIGLSIIIAIITGFPDFGFDRIGWPAEIVQYVAPNYADGIFGVLLGGVAEAIIRCGFAAFAWWIYSWWIEKIREPRTISKWEKCAMSLFAGAWLLGLANWIAFLKPYPPGELWTDLRGVPFVFFKIDDIGIIGFQSFFMWSSVIWNALVMIGFSLVLAAIWIWIARRTSYASSDRVQLEVGLNKSSAESAEQQSPGRKPWDQA